MMTRTHKTIEGWRRRIAWITVLLCFWMATGGVLIHTEDMRFGHSSSSRASLSLDKLLGGQDTACAACQWIDGSLIGFLTVSPPITRVCVLLPRSVTAFPTPIVRPVPHQLLRGPPISI